MLPAPRGGYRQGGYRYKSALPTGWRSRAVEERDGAPEQGKRVPSGSSLQGHSKVKCLQQIPQDSELLKGHNRKPVRRLSRQLSEHL